MIKLKTKIKKLKRRVKMYRYVFQILVGVNYHDGSYYHYREVKLKSSVKEFSNHIARGENVLLGNQALKVIDVKHGILEGYSLLILEGVNISYDNLEKLDENFEKLKKQYQFIEKI